MKLLMQQTLWGINYTLYTKSSKLPKAIVNRQTALTDD